MKPNPDHVNSLLNRAKEYDSVRQRHLNAAAEALDGRLHCIWLLRQAGVPMTKIERETGHSRQLLTKLLADFDPNTGKRIRPMRDTVQADPSTEAA